MKTHSKTIKKINIPSRKDKRTKQKVCVACDVLKTSKGVSISSDAKWVRDINKMNGRIGAPIHTERYKLLSAAGFPETYPSDSELKIILPAKDLKFNKLYYFASDPMSLFDSSKGHLKSAETAYGNYTNSGVVVKKGNTFTFRLRSPQPYISDGKQYRRHMHYFDIDNPYKLYTLSCVPDHKYVLPIVSPEKCIYLPSVFVCFEDVMMANNMGAICINSLEEKYGKIFNNELCIPYKLPIQNIKNKLRGIPKHKTLIIYCMKPECEAATLLMDKLTELGYNNLFYYSGGIEDKIEKIKMLV